jgi:hypothetical protein
MVPHINGKLLAFSKILGYPHKMIGPNTPAYFITAQVREKTSFMKSVSASDQQDNPFQTVATKQPTKHLTQGAFKYKG